MTNPLYRTANNIGNGGSHWISQINMSQVSNMRTPSSWTIGRKWHSSDASLFSRMGFGFRSKELSLWYSLKQVDQQETKTRKKSRTVSEKMKGGDCQYKLPTIVTLWILALYPRGVTSIGWERRQRSRFGIIMSHHHLRSGQCFMHWLECQVFAKTFTVSMRAPTLQFYQLASGLWNQLTRPVPMPCLKSAKSLATNPRLVPVLSLSPVP